MFHENESRLSMNSSLRVPSAGNSRGGSPANHSIGCAGAMQADSTSSRALASARVLSSTVGTGWISEDSPVGMSVQGSVDQAASSRPRAFHFASATSRSGSDSMTRPPPAFTLALHSPASSRSASKVRIRMFHAETPVRGS